MKNTEELDKLAILWNKKVKEWSYGKDPNNIGSVIRRESTSRKVRSVETDGGTRVSDVCGRPSRSHSNIQRISRRHEKWLVSK